MKKTLSILIFCFAFCFALAQQNSEQLIRIKFKNGSWIPKKCTVISYTPGDQGNGTQSYWLFPGGTQEWQFKEGTKLYMANQKQVDLVMGGKRIDDEKPFLIVTREDQDKVIKF